MIRAFPTFHPALAVFYLLFALMPLQWMVIGSFGGFTLRPSYLAILAMFVIVATRPKLINAMQSVVARHGIWLLPYTLYVAWLTLAMVGTPGQGIAFRQVFFLLSFLAAASIFAQTGVRAATVRRLGGLALLSFIVVTEYLASKVGQSWTIAIPRFLTTGDLDYIIYGFFRATFNAVENARGTEVGAAEKNALSVAVFTAGVLFRMGAPRSAPDRLGQAVMAGVIFLLVLLNTRSVLLVAIAGLPLALWLGIARNGIGNLPALASKSLLLFAGAAVALLIVSSGHAVFEALSTRFSFGDSSTVSRFHQWNWALSRIEGNVLTGAGYGEIDGHPVHNLFLGAWMHAGLGAFLLVTGAYLAFLAIWLRHLTDTVLRPKVWHLDLRPEWIALLPMTPLFRVWLSGDAGHPVFVEWMGLAVFCGALTANAATARNLTGR